MTLNTAMLTSNKKDWCTPENILNLVRQLGTIVLDPCSNKNSIVSATIELMQPKHDGLACSWNALQVAGSVGRPIVYVNPPYGKGVIEQWIDKICYEAMAWLSIVALLPARPDTKWFNKLWASSKLTSICFWKGRIKFIGADSGAPFPSVIAAININKQRFEEVFRNYGIVIHKP